MKILYFNLKNAINLHHHHFFAHLLVILIQQLTFNKHIKII